MNNKNLIIFFLIIILLGGLVTFLLFGSKEKSQPIEEKTTISDEKGIGIEASPVVQGTPPKLSDGMDLSKNYEEKFEAVEDTVSGVKITDIKEVLSFPNNTLDISDWKTYRNEIYKFELKYPKDWVIEDRLAIGQNKETGKDSVYFYGNDSYDKGGSSGDFFAKSGVGMVNKIDIFSVSDYSLSEIIYHFENSEVGEGSVKVKKQFKVNNTIGILTETRDYTGDDGVEFYSGYVLSGRVGTNNITFSFHGVSNDKYKNELEQILLSFKILE